MFCVPGLIQGWGWGVRRVGLRLHLFVSDGDPGNEDFMYKRVCTKIFLPSPKVGKVLLRSSASC